MPKTTPTLRITVPQLSALSLSGAADLRARGLRGDRFKLEVSGAGRMTLQGQVDHLEIDASGAAQLDAKDLTARVANVDISGMGDASVRATDTLDVTISGAGNVAYYGDPKQVHPQISGVGRLVKK